MKRFTKFGLVLVGGVLLASLVGCAELSSLKDGFLGKPLNEAANGDIPGFYHLGEALNPVIHAILAILRGVFGL